MSGRINETWLVAVSLGLLCAVAWWLIVSYDREEAAYPPMSTYSPRPEGAKALLELSRYAGLDVQRFHDSEYDYPAEACVLILDKPDTTTTALLGGMLDVRALRLWLEDGGKLVLFSEPLRVVAPELFAEIDRGAGLTPYGGSVFDWDIYTGEHEAGAGDGWAAQVEEGAHSTSGQPAYQADDSVVAAWSSVSREAGSAGALWRMYKIGRLFELPEQRPALWATVEMIETAPADITPYVRGDVLLAAEDPAWPIVVYRRVGRGELFWVTRPELAANGWIGRADNHRLVLALLTQASAGGPLLVDEHIHGFVRRGPGATWLLFNTTGGRLLLVLAAMLIMLFLGAAVRPAKYLPQPRPPRRQAAEMVLAQADLYRRAGSAGQAAFHLLEGVRRALADSGSGGAPVDRQTLSARLAGMSREADLNHRDVQMLADYLDGHRAASPTELLQLARVCDAVHAALHKQSF